MKYVTKGVSLIELMVALAIGAIVVLGVAQVFSATRSSSQVSTALARVQESARFGLEFFRFPAQHAGNAGCYPGNAAVLDPVAYSPVMYTSIKRGSTQVSYQYPLPTGTVAPEFLEDFRYDVRGYDATGTQSNLTTAGAYALPAIPAPGAAGDWAPALPADIAGLNPRPIAGSDIVVFRYAMPYEARLETNSPTITNPIDIRTAPLVGTPDAVASLSARGPYFASSCVGGPASMLVFAATNVTTAGTTFRYRGNVGRNGPVPAAEGLIARFFTSLARAEIAVIYVGLNPNGLPSLYRAQTVFSNAGVGFTLQSEELVDGVENIQLMYGVDNTPNSIEAVNQSLVYLDATGVAALTGIGTQTLPGGIAAPPELLDIEKWRRVVSVRVGLLARAPELMATQTGTATTTYRLNGIDLTVPAGNERQRLRAAYEETVALRNRLRNFAVPVTAGP